MSEAYLVAFDMDGTLLPINSSWEFVHKLLGTEEIASRYRRMYERGEIDYRRWAELDVSSWRDRDFSIVLREVENLRPIEDAEEAVRRLKEEGFVVGLISSGLDVIAERLCNLLRMDFCRSAKLRIVNGRVLGILRELDPERKSEELTDVARRFGVPLRRVAFVGDGESDLSVFRMQIGKKIAFRPRSEVIMSLADHVVDSLSEAADILIKWKRFDAY